MKWERLQDFVSFDQIAPGDIITDAPEDPVDQYEIVAVDSGTVKAYHCKGKNAILILNYAEFLNQAWYVRSYSNLFTHGTL